MTHVKIIYTRAKLNQDLKHNQALTYFVYLR